MLIKNTGQRFYPSVVLLACFVLIWATPVPAEDPVRRGEYVFRLAGCLGCHTDSEHHGATLAGGRALATPFGTFYTPNITPDPVHGIGKWREEDFFRAVTLGIGVKTGHYFPVFPYPAYTRISQNDLYALWAFLRTVPAVAQANKPHEVPWYLGSIASWGWQLLFFKPGVEPVQPTPGQSPAWQRGEYIAKALAHCGECHTPRTRFGTLDRALSYAGTPQGPEGAVVPNITPDPKTGIGQWTQTDLVDFFKDGGLPNGDFTGGLMAEVIDNGLKYLTHEDAEALATYIKSLPSMEHDVSRKKKAATPSKP
ncbi:hypothetical protein CCP4SC76_6470008 [Gammaproteobacteria bacterium]